MGIDLRRPLGLLFALLGLLLVGYGLLTRGAPMYDERSLGLNVNLLWGLVLCVFGGGMLLLTRRSGDAPAPPG